MDQNRFKDILVINSGSSSLKFKLFSRSIPDELKLLVNGSVTGFGAEASCIWTSGGRRQETRQAIRNHGEATGWVIEILKSSGYGKPFTAESVGIGHRVVHGGDKFTAPVRVTEGVLAELETLSMLAPLHNPLSVEVMRACQSRLGSKIPMVAVFDTSFFQKLPAHARAYALPSEWAEPFKIRRYGFHGIAHQYLFGRYLEMSGADPENVRVITLQLGHGCSVTAIQGGAPVETSMGFTPLEGLVMATRPGDLDSGILLHLMMQHGLSPEQLYEGLNRRSGLWGLSGIGPDMRELLKLESQGHAGASLAIRVFCHRVRKYLGAYLAVLGGADAVVFGGGIGEHAPTIRERILDGMTWCNILIDPGRNREIQGNEGIISSDRSPCRAYVISVDEESIIARETLRCLDQ